MVARVLRVDVAIDRSCELILNSLLEASIDCSLNVVRSPFMQDLLSMDIGYDVGYLELHEGGALMAVPV